MEKRTPGAKAQKKYRERKRAEGYIDKLIWIKVDQWETLQKVIDVLNDGTPNKLENLLSHYDMPRGWPVPPIFENIIEALEKAKAIASPKS